MSERTFALVVTLCLLLPGSASALHDPNDLGLDADEQKCLNEVNKGVAKVAKTQGKDICDCIKNGSKGKLGGQTIEECMTADNKGKVAKAKSKLASKVGDKCPPAYDHTPTDPNFLNARAMQKELDLVHWWFGPDLDTVILSQTDPNTKDTAKCQIDVARAGKKCQNTKLKVYNKCKKDGLKAGAVQTLDGLARTCLQTDPNDPTTGIPDPKGKVAKSCNGKLSSKIQKKCVDAGVSLNAAFPGSDPNGTNDPAALLAWIEEMVECEVCLLVNAVDGLARDCDLFDDGLLNGSCSHLCENDPRRACTFFEFAAFCNSCCRADQDCNTACTAAVGEGSCVDPEKNLACGLAVDRAGCSLECCPP